MQFVFKYNFIRDVFDLYSNLPASSSLAFIQIFAKKSVHPFFGLSMLITSYKKIVATN